MNAVLRNGLLPLLLVGFAVAPSVVLAQNDDNDERRSVTIRVDADSIYVERNGETVVVPNTPEGRAQLDEDDIDLDGGMVRIEIDRDIDLDRDIDVDGEDVRVFRIRRGEGGLAEFDGTFEREFEFDGPGVAVQRFGPRGLAEFRFGDDVRWTSEDSQAEAEIMTKEMQSRQLAQEIRAAEAAERADLEAALDDLLTELFEMKLDQRRGRVERLEENLDEQRDALAEREAARAEIIERRKQQLLGEDTLEW